MVREQKNIMSQEEILCLIISPIVTQVPLSLLIHDARLDLHGNLAMDLCSPRVPSLCCMHGFLSTNRKT